MITFEIDRRFEVLSVIYPWFCVEILAFNNNNALNLTNSVAQVDFCCSTWERMLSTKMG